MQQGQGEEAELRARALGERRSDIVMQFLKIAAVVSAYW